MLLGVEHIPWGVDHLVFVLALLLIVRGRWLLIKTITAFTAAHGVTLALATLGLARFPSACKQNFSNKLPTLLFLLAFFLQ